MRSSRAPPPIRSATSPLISRHAGQQPSNSASIFRRILRDQHGLVTACDASDPADLPHACAFHEAGFELHQAIVGVLSRWTLARLLEKPYLAAKHLHERCLVRAGLFSVARNTIKDDVG